jgi:hypothetical protein
MGQAAEAENRSGVTSQPPIGAASTQQRLGEVTKAEGGGRATGQLPKVRKRVDPRADL